ncbi:hypothetical protein Goklo_008117 [Gossypium klotzschianum]|uniref:Uncharacterized protein n=1 Tax=Gossypium klotzschianum TaxID=34286 RepID=A0A7J8UZL2_9ROSI|nr:hypothetical protein [Gossypium klotzschianum]
MKQIQKLNQHQKQKIEVPHSLLKRKSEGKHLPKGRAYGETLRHGEEEEGEEERNDDEVGEHMHDDTPIPYFDEFEEAFVPKRPSTKGVVFFNLDETSHIVVRPIEYTKMLREEMTRERWSLSHPFRDCTIFLSFNKEVDDLDLPSHTLMTTRGVLKPPNFIVKHIGDNV